MPALGELNEYDRETIAEVEKVKQAVEHNGPLPFPGGAKEAMNLARIGNKYLADTEPWKTAKSDMERTATILNIALQITANLSIVMEPFLPFSTEKIRAFLQTERIEWDALGSFDLLKEGHALGEASLLFEKIEDEVIEQQVQKLLDTKKNNEASKQKAKPIKELVQFDAFEKLDIRVGTILECEKVPKTDKLLRFLLDDGLAQRTILSGIAQWYPNPEELIGKQVCFIANLEPRKMRGILSEGMILSAENSDGSLSLISPSGKIDPGSQVV